QMGIAMLLSLSRSGPAHGIFFFADLFNVIGTVLGLLGYAVAAAVLPSSASATASFAAGALWVVAAVTLVYVIPELPPVTQLPAGALLCFVLAGASYFAANRVRSNSRLSGPRAGSSAKRMQ